jgi:peptidoglycan hydrolase-like protein with peptidoglycan-binding domain
MQTLFPVGRWLRVGLCALVTLALTGAASAKSSPAKTHKSARSANKIHAVASKHSAKSKTSAKSTTHKASSSSKTSHTKKGSKTAKKGKKRGQQAIDSTRARQIQEALIREHYMQGEPSGAWDTQTQDAMKRYQADHGWQSKTTPDSRALIKLGLGPNHDHLLNPESAMTSAAAASDPKDGAKQTPAIENVPQR